MDRTTSRATRRGPRGAASSPWRPAWARPSRTSSCPTACRPRRVVAHLPGSSAALSRVTVTIERADAAEADELAPVLTALCRRAKAHWGYPADLLARWADDLRIEPADIVAGCGPRGPDAG